MSFPDIMIFITGLLQFVVAGYALRLNRLFGSARVGCSLFWAFMLLALLHLVQFAVSFHDAGVASFGNEIAVMYALIPVHVHVTKLTLCGRTLMLQLCTSRQKK